MNSLTQAKEFYKLKIMKNTHQDRPRNTHTDKVACKTDVNNTKYLCLIDSSSGYHNLRLDENHLTSQHLHASLEGTDTDG